MKPFCIFTKFISTLQIISTVHEGGTGGIAPAHDHDKAQVTTHPLGTGYLKSLCTRDELDNAIQYLIRGAPHQMNYDISRGISTMRNLSSIEETFFDMIDSTSSSSPSSILVPLLILLIGNGDSCFDKAHECILGVNMTNIEKAEYAATHPGQTSWSVDHPLTTEQDMLHAIIHRLEGHHLGEGGHEGYENAKYWLTGGDKKLESVPYHKVRRQLKDYVMQSIDRFACLDLIVNGDKDSLSDGSGNTTSTRTYDIIAGGGKTRKVHAYEGEFDFFRFVDLCDKRYSSNHNRATCASRLKENDWKEEWSVLIDELQEVEMLRLVQSSLSVKLHII